jgi:hypothetical protein
MPLDFPRYVVEIVSSEMILGETCAESARNCSAELVVAANSSSTR